MKADQEASYIEFVTARQQHLARIAYAVTGDQYRAEDLLQTALVELYRAWPRVQRNGAEEAYVRQILVRTAIDESRRGWFRRERVDSTLAHAEALHAVHDPGPEENDALFAALQAATGATTHRGSVPALAWPERERDRGRDADQPGHGQVAHLTGARGPAGPAGAGGGQSRLLTCSAALHRPLWRTWGTVGRTAGFCGRADVPTTLRALTTFSVPRAT